MRLFIIGNGFDIDHGLCSKYSYFKEYLINTYLPTLNRDYITYPNVYLAPDGGEIVDPNSSSQILYCLINDISLESNWGDFEECLGHLDYYRVLELVEKDEEKPSHYYYNIEDIVRDLDSSLFFSVSEIFCEWVETIDLSSAYKKYNLSSSDLFLSFNYTPLLEDVYKINPDRICHIHGSINERICIIGHGNNSRVFNEYDECVSFEIEQLHNKLLKPTEKLYSKNQYFFRKIYKSNITEIVFFGFSFSQIDYYYFKQLFCNLDTTNIKAFLSPYETANELDLKIKLIREFGFKGTYSGMFKPK